MLGYSSFVCVCMLFCVVVSFTKIFSSIHTIQLRMCGSHTCTIYICMAYTLYTLYTLYNGYVVFRQHNALCNYSHTHTHNICILHIRYIQWHLLRFQFSTIALCSPGIWPYNFGRCFSPSILFSTLPPKICFCYRLLWVNEV